MDYCRKTAKYLSALITTAEVWMDDAKLEVVRDIGRKNLANIGARLRDLADWVEAHPEVRTVLVVSAAHDRVVSVHGYGERCSAVEALGWLDLAAHRARGGDAPRTDIGPPPAA